MIGIASICAIRRAYEATPSRTRSGSIRARARSSRPRTRSTRTHTGSSRPRTCSGRPASDGRQTPRCGAGLGRARGSALGVPLAGRVRRWRGHASPRGLHEPADDLRRPISRAPASTRPSGTPTSAPRGSFGTTRGHLPSPYSGPNTPVTNEQAMYGPSQVSVDDGLTLTAQRNTNVYSRYLFVDQRRGDDRRKVQPADDRLVRAGEDQGARHDAGLVAGPVVLPKRLGTPFNEIDFVQGGFTEGSGP